MYLYQVSSLRQLRVLQAIASRMKREGYDDWTIEQSIIVAQDSKVSDVMDTLKELRK